MSLGPTDGSQQRPLPATTTTPPAASDPAALGPIEQPAPQQSHTQQPAGSPPPHVQQAPAWQQSYVPQPAAWQPPAPAWLAAPPKPRGPSPVVFIVVLLLAVGVTLAGLQLLPIPTASPTGETRPGSSASPTPSASTDAPTTGQHPDLTENKIYPMSVSGSCPSVHTPSSMAAYKKQVGELLTCLAGIFDPLIERAGAVPIAVGHVFYGKQVDTPCGGEADAYAFYCESDRTIYLSEQVYEDSQYARLSVADTVIHEYGHHVQEMAGIFEAADKLDESQSVIVRREELQVFCWTYYVFASVPTFELTATDRAFIADLWSQTSDPDGHGTVTAQKYWGARGLSGRNLGACNTWSVPKSKVR